MRTFITATFIATLVAAPSAEASEAAFAWAGRPGTAKYTAPPAYAHNPSGRPIEITRKAAGQYEVRFEGLAQPARGGHVQVSAYGSGPEHCKVVRWVPKEQDLSIAVRCFSGQRPADSAFTVRFEPSEGGSAAPSAPEPPPPPPRERKVSMRPTGDAPMVGNPRGGTAYRDRCPAGSAITGVQAYVAGSLEGIQVVCSRVKARPDGSGVTISGGQLSAVRGRARGQRARSDCPSQHVVIGFDGRSGQLVDRLTLRCASLRVARRGRLVVDQQRSSRTIGKSGGRQFPLRSCPRNSFATAGVIRAGNSVDAFTLGCSEARITP